MYRLRLLKQEDAPLMLEWMHDDSVVHDLKTSFMSKTLDDCISFIDSSNDKKNLHFAIADDNDEYLGTVSLKNIYDCSAEFAITVRKKAMGTGCSLFGMKEIIKYGFNKLNLRCIYWCVSRNNLRALRFYDKNGYKRTPVPKKVFGYTNEEKSSYIWFSCNNPEI